MGKSELGKNLRALREKCGFTQQQLANALNIDRSTYSYYEAGKTSPDIPALIALANIFSVSTDELLGQEASVSFVRDSGSSRLRRSSKRGNENDSHIYDLKKDELQLIAYYRAANADTRSKLLSELLPEEEKNDR